MRIGSPVQSPESQLTANVAPLTANVAPPAAISRSATTVGTLTIGTLAFARAELLVAFAHDRPQTLALHRGELGVAFAHDPPQTLALRRGEVGELARDPPKTIALERSKLAETVATFLVGESVSAGPK